jgi:hypothetical protein
LSDAARRRKLGNKTDALGPDMFDAFYAQYVAACAGLAVTPLSTRELRELIAALLERDKAIVH